MSSKELQSKIQRWNNITKIEKIVLTVGEEVSVEDIKPKIRRQTLHIPRSTRK